MDPKHEALLKRWVNERLALVAACFSEREIQEAAPLTWHRLKELLGDIQKRALTVAVVDARLRMIENQFGPELRNTTWTRADPGPTLFDFIDEKGGVHEP